MSLDRLAGGWNSLGTSICENCVAAPALKQVVQEGDIDGAACDYCKSESTSDLAVADGDVVLDHIVRSLLTEYDEAINVLFWDEGEYVGTTWDSHDLLSVHADEIGDEQFLATSLVVPQGGGNVAQPLWCPPLDNREHDAGFRG